MSGKKQLGEKGFRHELKYYITEGDHALLSRKLSLTMEQDAFAKKSGGEYFIRSLYFDDRDDSAFREKLDGTDERDKFRIRIYNMRDDVIKLECKHKSNGYIKKQSVNLSRKEYEQLMMGRRGFLLNRPEPFAKRMYLKPAVIVDYTREPFVFPMEDVRITFDKDIRTAYRATDIFDAKLPTYPVIDGGDMVLEVKFNRFLSTYVRSLLQPERCQRSAISKYVLCRKFEL
mgnify:CR=1 FL=1